MQDQPQRVDVAAGGDVLAGLLLGRHISRSPDAQIAQWDLGGKTGKAEVRNPHLSAPVYHNVGGLQIAMEYASFVRGAQSRADLSCELDGFVLRQPPDAAQQGS
jgi:hypothetical protein